MSTVATLALLIGCGGGEPDPTTPTSSTTGSTPPPVFQVVQVEPAVEILHEGPVDAAVPAGAGWIGLVDGERTWTTGEGEVIALGPGAIPRGAAEAWGTLWLLDDDGLSVRVGDQLVDAGLGGLLPGAATALHADGDDLWIETDGGLVLWSKEQLFAVAIDGAPAEGPAAPGAVLYDEKVTWIAHGHAVHALAGNGFAWKVFETRDLGGPIDAVQVVGDRVLVSVGGKLWIRDGSGWWSPTIDEPVGTLLGGLGGAWEIGTAGPRFVAEDALWAGPDGAIPEPPGRWWVDELGRLLMRTDTDVRSIALHRPLRLTGVAPGEVIDTQRTVTLVPTAPEHLDALALSWVHATEPEVPIALSGDQATLDPSGLLPGTWTLRGEATYDDRDPSVVEVPVLVELVGGVTWTEHIGPLHERTCAVCHEGDADTVLDGPEAWEAHIDDILLNIGNGNMPLGGPRLSAAQVDLVQGWKDGGFLP
ncbi:MAG: cytochrome c [Alphaproteobacteria bacterium]|nr:cytochrome c [Alphaproteobacteria bacterium]